MLGLCVTVASHGRTMLGIDESRLRSVMDLCYNLDPAAPDAIAALARDHPGSPLPDLIRVQRLYWLQAYAETDAELTARFEREAEALLPRTGRYADRHPGDADAVMVSAINQLALGLFYVERGRMWAAFWKIRSGRGVAARLLEQYPDYNDAKLPVGLSECYLERTPGYLKPLAALLGGSADMQDGIRRLKEARDGGLLTSVEAGFQLSQVYFYLLHDAGAATEEMRRLVVRYPANPFFQRFLAYGECLGGRRADGWARYRHAAELEAVADYPALAVRPLMFLCWDAMAAKDYATALQASVDAEAAARTKPSSRPLRGETLIGQGEALKALGRYAECFERFETAAAHYPGVRRHALTRVREIKKEIGWSEPTRPSRSKD